MFAHVIRMGLCNRAEIFFLSLSFVLSVCLYHCFVPVCSVWVNVDFFLF